MPWFVRNQRRLRLTVPTLALDGDADPLTEGVPDSWQLFTDAMQWHVLSGVGHFPAEEAPEETTLQILEFMEA